MNLNRTWILVFCIIIFFESCKHARKQSEGEKLARQYCGSCHQFPEPSLLDKVRWDKGVLPQMAFRMGMPEDRIRYQLSPKELSLIKDALPAQPMLSMEDFEKIKSYYLSEAPDSISVNQKTIADTITQFTAETFGYFSPPSVTLLEYDSVQRKLFLGNAQANLFLFDEDLGLVDSLALASPPTHLISNDTATIISVVGNLLPSDQANGKICLLGKNNGQEIIDSLKRPVFFEVADLDEDHQEELIICSFGNYMGSLEIIKNPNQPGGAKITLSKAPGARKTMVTDWDGDGRKDIIALFAQGDERLVFYKNLGNLNFEEKVLYRFPPIYGSSFFDLVDFNRDGLLDIVYTNGDNADYSAVTKPYHGIKVFLHQKSNELKEFWSYSIPGAWQAKVLDFDKDGDLDIAVISLFPSKRHLEQSFIYFENLGDNKFHPEVFPAVTKGTWMALLAYDVDHDNDTDIVMGAFDFKALTHRFSKRNSSNTLLIMKNNKIK